MTTPIVECVPNVSEGRDDAKIRRITDAIESVGGIKLLDVDPGRATNRTVITFVGPPDAVVEAAFRCIETAAEVIDMRTHTGEHPRMGATDVCPLVPISGIDMATTADYARRLGERVGRELGIPGYFYENAATTEERRNLAHCRSGEYEGLDKLSQPQWKPDFGPAELDDRVRRTGATAIAARDFLVAYNVNLNTTSTRRANAIAFDIREAGRTRRHGHPLTGEIVLDENGEPERIPGKLECVKGIGWYIPEYGIAQISYNLTNISVTPVHVAFDETCKSADARGIRVTGSELVGLIPLQAMLDAADYFLAKQSRSLGIPELEKIKIAVKSLGLDELSPFEPRERIIEYMLDADRGSRLVDRDLVDFANETASESPAPGGGSISAYVGALGASLGSMVANLSAHKRGWDERWEEFSQWAVEGLECQRELLTLVDRDTDAFNRIMEAFGMPRGSEAEQAERHGAIQAATRNAIEIPLRVMEVAERTMAVCKAMAETGNPNSVTDAGVGALCARTAVLGAFMNVKINTGGLDDAGFVREVLERGEAIQDRAIALEGEIRDLVEAKI